VKSTDPLVLRARQLALAKQERATAERLERLRDELDIISNLLARPARSSRMFADAGPGIGDVITLASRFRHRRKL
jgi:hypothetical protein